MIHLRVVVLKYLIYFSLYDIAVRAVEGLFKVHYFRENYRDRIRFNENLIEGLSEVVFNEVQGKSV